MKTETNETTVQKKEWMTCFAVSWMAVQSLVKIERKTSQMKEQSQIRYENNVENVSLKVIDS